MGNNISIAIFGLALLYASQSWAVRAAPVERRALTALKPQPQMLHTTKTSLPRSIGKSTPRLFAPD
jgi:hypothetical protein